MSRRLYPFLTALPTAALPPGVSGAVDAASKHSRAGPNPAPKSAGVFSRSADTTHPALEPCAEDDEKGRARAR